MDYFERVQKVIDYIETNLKEKISLEDLAKISYFSKFHFHRVFLAVVGDPVMEYIRKRRLSEAVLELQNSEKRITDIAYDYIFNSSDTFSRAFKRQYGINPEEYRKYQPQVTLFEKQNIMDLRGAGDIHGLCKPNIVLGKQFMIVGLETYISRNEFLELIENNVENREADQIAFNFFNNLKHKVSNQLNPDVEICYNYDCDDGYRSMVCVEVDSLESISEEMNKKIIVSNRYAVFSHSFMLTPEQITIKVLEDTIYKNAYARWFPYVNYEPSEPYTIELYNINQKSEGITKVEVYIPVRQTGI
jgi:AraC family transcriptional regulator